MLAWNHCYLVAGVEEQMFPEAKKEGWVSGQVGLEDMHQGCHTEGRTQALPETPGHNAFSVLMAIAHIAVTVIPMILLQPCTGLKAWVIGKSLLELGETPCLSAWVQPIPKQSLTIRDNKDG